MKNYSPSCAGPRAPTHPVIPRQALHRRSGRAAGFTLVELMITVAILAILVSLALPSFSGLVRNTKITTDTNKLVADLNLALSQATNLKVSGNVSLCASTDGKTCSGSTDWSGGWLVFVDKGVSGNMDTSEGDVLIRSYTSDSGTSNATSMSSVTFRPNGALQGAVIPLGVNPPAVAFNITKSGCGKGEMRIVSVVISTGRISTAKGDCP